VVRQDKTNIDGVRHALFKAVFGSEAVKALARRKKVGNNDSSRARSAVWSSSESQSSEEDEDEDPGQTIDGKPTPEASDDVAGGDGNPAGTTTRRSRSATRKLSPRGMERMLRSQLSDSRCLLVLDDCDRVIMLDWMKKLLGKILRDDKGVHVLMSCRDVPTGLSTFVPGLLFTIVIHYCQSDACVTF
jgi:hypothetical protein